MRIYKVTVGYSSTPIIFSTKESLLSFLEVMDNANSFRYVGEVGETVKELIPFDERISIEVEGDVA